MLSQNDSIVLTRIFDPESSASAPLMPIDPSLPSDPHILDTAYLQELQRREIEAIKLAESSLSLPDADAKKIQTLYDARKLLDGVVADAPKYASAFNNRAQLNRLLAPLLPTAERKALSRAVHDDLTSAIELSAPSSPSAAISTRQAKILSQAYTQRGTMYFSAAQEETAWWGEENWESVKDELEVKARRDFFEGGRAGSEVAREMSVRTNPMAKLCGQIVKNAMKREGAA